MSRVRKIHPGQVSAETAPVNKEVGAKTMTAKQHPVSKSAMYRYLRHCLQLKPLKLRR